ncbi:unnamed protein product [Echinostoma caproni]|uniref:Uncharacterized protein n=1 Tax=Echinostoma caproni TaxID=27848 RepID=A0A3P8I8M1_9TREM|nr:unnamed protein product [Echinostoma caproni]
MHPKYRRQQDRCPAEEHPLDILSCSAPGLTKSLLTLGTALFSTRLLHTFIV